jgi:hypothetical protein
MHPEPKSPAKTSPHEIHSLGPDPNGVLTKSGSLGTRERIGSEDVQNPEVNWDHEPGSGPLECGDKSPLFLHRSLYPGPTMFWSGEAKAPSCRRSPRFMEKLRFLPDPKLNTTKRIT